MTTPRTLLLAASLVSSFALAQEGFPSLNVNIHVKEGARATGGKAALHEEQTGEGFRLTRDSDPDGDAWFKVLSPEGAQVRVLDPVGFPVAAGVVPVSFRAKENTFYTVELHTSAGAVARKFEAKPAMVTQVWLSTAPARTPPAPPLACGADADFEQVAAAIQQESFSSGKLRVLGDVASSRGFCADQVVKLLALFDFEGDKLSALKLLAPGLTDRENKFKVYQALDFDSTRDQAKKILAWRG